MNSLGQAVLAGIGLTIAGTLGCMIAPDAMGKVIGKVGILDTTVNEAALKKLHQG